MFTGSEFVNLTIISDHAFITVGETAFLVCAGSGLPDVDISWMHNGHVLSNSSFVSISDEYFVQGESILHQSFLQICDFETAEAGAYICIVGNGENSANSSTELTVSGKALINSRSIFHFLKTLHKEPKN